MNNKDQSRRRPSNNNTRSAYNRQVHKEQKVSSKVVQFQHKKQRKEPMVHRMGMVIKTLDYELILATIFLVIFGLVMLYSISAYSAGVEMGDTVYFFKRQVIFTFVLGIPIVVLAIIGYYILIPKGTFLCYLFTIVLCLLVQSGMGSSAGGAQRRLNIGGFGFQPSEFVKISVIMMIPLILCSCADNVQGSWGKALAQPSKIYHKIVEKSLLKNKSRSIFKRSATMRLLLAIITCGWTQILLTIGIGFLVVWKFTDNLSTALIVGGIGFIVTSLTFKKPHLWYIFGVAMIPICKIVGRMGIDFMSSIGHVYTKEIVGFRMWRILVWLKPELDADGMMQTTQGIYALSSGGFLGKGLGQGTQKLNRIPEVQNDMILSAIIEEIGICGVILIIALYVILLHRIYVIAKQAPDLHSQLLVMGVFAHIALQVLCNMGVITGMLPNTGITLPFFSYGGTAILGLAAELGIVLGVSSKSKRLKMEAS